MELEETSAAQAITLLERPITAGEQAEIRKRIVSAHRPASVESRGDVELHESEALFDLDHWLIAYIESAQDPAKPAAKRVYMSPRQLKSIKQQGASTYEQLWQWAGTGFKAGAATARAIADAARERMLNEVERSITDFLSEQRSSGMLTEEIFERTQAAAYQNFRAWLADANIARLTLNVKKGILAGVRRAQATGNWDNVIEAFRQEITFGTAGIRGLAAFSEAELKQLKQQGPDAEILQGPNTINLIVLWLKTAGVIAYAKKQGMTTCVVGYDSRVAGWDFARSIAGMLLAADFTLYLFDEASPFPELSFAVPALGADLGILISASHNPSNYNGYKITDRTGKQLTGETRNAIVASLGTVTTADIRLIPLTEAKPGKLIWLGGSAPLPDRDYAGVDVGRSSANFIDLHGQFVQQVGKFILEKQTVYDYAPKVEVGFAAFNGAGCKAVPRILDGLGFQNVTAVSSLQRLDGEFPAFGWGEQPDPGDPIAAEIAVREFIAEHGRAKFDKLDILIGTDPDADRAGIIVKVPDVQQGFFGEYRLLSANDAWTLLVWYRLQRLAERNNGRVPAGRYVTVSHVTSDAIERVALKFGVPALGQMLDQKGNPAGHYLNGRRTWVGFGYIAEFVATKRNEGWVNLAGAEESNGFSILGGPIEAKGGLGAEGHVNDKDGTFAAMLLSEVAAFAKKQGTTLFQLLDSIYLDPEVGYYATANKPLPRVGSFEGAPGVTKKIRLLRRAQDWEKRANRPGQSQSDRAAIGGIPVIGAVEFKTGRYDAQHYAGFPDEGIRFFFPDPGLKPEDHFTMSRNYITIRPSGTSQTIRFYTQLFATGLGPSNVADLKFAVNRCAEALSLIAQIELLKAEGYLDDAAAVEKQLDPLNLDSDSVYPSIEMTFQELEAPAAQ